MKKNNITLYIDTADIKKTKVSLLKNGQLIYAEMKSRTFTSQILLDMISEIVKKNKFNLSQLNRIEFNPGPGSYTGLKVGAAVANTLGWLLGIPVNDKKDSPALPVYE